MKRKIKEIRTLIAMTVIGSVVLGSALGYADSTDYAIAITEKLGRGVGNVLSSPLELPCAIRDDVSKQGAAGIGTGLFRGLALFVRRVLVGVTEAGTFIIPMEATLPRVCAKKPAPAIEKKTT